MQALRMKTQNFKHKTQNQINPKFSGCNLQKRYMHNFFFFFFSFFFFLNVHGMLGVILFMTMIIQCLKINLFWKLLRWMIMMKLCHF